MKGLVSLSKKCKYNRENIRQIEKDVDEYVIDTIINRYGERIDCQRDAETEDGFCLLHDPKAWSIKPNEVLSKFYNELKKGERFFIGIHFPTVELSKRKFERLEMPLCKFHQRADFSGAEFSSEANFSGAKFFGSTTFDNSTFFEKALFEKSDFSHELLVNCLNPYNMISFRRVEFEKPEKVVFDGCDMKRVSFIHTNIERINFRNLKWNGYKIYDEKLLLLKNSEKERKEFVENGRRKLKKILEGLNEEVKDNEVNEEIEKVLELRIPNVLKEIRELESKKRVGYEEERLNELYEELKKEKEKIKNEVNEAIKKALKKYKEIFIGLMKT